MGNLELIDSFGGGLEREREDGEFSEEELRGSGEESF